MKTLALGELVYVDKGVSYSGRYLTPEGVPMVNLKCFERGGGFRSEGTKPYSGPYKSRHVVRSGDLVIANTDLTQSGEIIGSPALIPDAIVEGIISHHVSVLRFTSKRIDRRYLYYRLRCPDFKAHARSRASGTTVLGLRSSDVLDFGIKLPSMRTQQQVVAVLAAYDALIDNNLRRIEVLEEMAQAIYREWFVNFRYPGHEAGDLVDSPLGPIPEGWRAGTLSDVVVLQRGFDLPKGRREPGDVPVVAASGVQGTHSVSKVHGPGVCTGRSGTIGRVTYVDRDFWPLNTALWIKEYRASVPEHAYFFLRDLDLERYASGAAVPTLNRNHLALVAAVVTPPAILAAFSTAVASMFSLTSTLVVQNANLRVTRDLLLPRLLSGEIDVSRLDIDTSWLVA